MLHTNERIIKHKVGLLNLAEELGNVSKACQVMGLSRDTFYRYKHALPMTMGSWLFAPEPGLMLRFCPPARRLALQPPPVPSSWHCLRLVVGVKWDVSVLR